MDPTQLACVPPSLSTPVGVDGEQPAMNPIAPVSAAAPARILLIAFIAACSEAANGRPQRGRIEVVGAQVDTPAPIIANPTSGM